MSENEVKVENEVKFMQLERGLLATKTKDNLECRDFKLIF